METIIKEKTITHATVEVKSFHALLSGALTHASKDPTLFRFYGVYLSRENGKLIAKATDRYRLIVGSIESEGEGESAPIRLGYTYAKDLASKLSKEKRGKVEITFAGDLISISLGGGTFTYTANADEFPPYAHFFPAEGATPIPVTAFSFNPSFFADYGKIAGKRAQVIISQYKENHAYSVEMNGDLEGVTWRALLMPMRKI